MDLWQKCVDFHGHSCGGLRIGYAAAEYAMKLLNISFSDNEQVVCISENDACGVDAIQVLYLRAFRKKEGRDSHRRKDHRGNARGAFSYGIGKAFL